jgi:hypothetical protein
VCRACGSDAHYLDDCPVANQRPVGDQARGRRGPQKEIGRKCPSSKFDVVAWLMLFGGQLMNAGFVYRIHNLRMYIEFYCYTDDV